MEFGVEPFSAAAAGVHYAPVSPVSPRRGQSPTRGPRPGGKRGAKAKPAAVPLRAAQTGPPPAEVVRAPKQKLTGLAQNPQVGPAVCLEIQIRVVKLAESMGQLCACYLSAKRAVAAWADVRMGGAIAGRHADGGRVQGGGGRAGRRGRGRGRGCGRARSHRRCVPPLIHFMPDLQTYSVPFCFLNDNATEP